MAFSNHIDFAACSVEASEHEEFNWLLICDYAIDNQTLEHIMLSCAYPLGSPDHRLTIEYVLDQYWNQSEKKLWLENQGIVVKFEAYRNYETDQWIVLGAAKLNSSEQAMFHLRWA